MLMKINSYDRLSYIEITFVDALSPETIKATGRNDICIKIEVSCNNFCGRNDDIWFAWDEIQGFLMQFQETFSDRVKKGRIGLPKTAHTRRTSSVIANFLSGSTTLRFA